MEQQKNEMRDMTDFSYKSQRLNKSKELNSRMSIKQESRDEYESKTRNIQGGQE